MSSRIRVAARKLDGILLLDKSIGLSSNAALQKVKRLYNAKKAGHTGSLDPLASGMLPICFGGATKFSQFLLTADKSYVVEAQLGVTTTTGDAEGDVVATRSFDKVDESLLKNCIQKFVGVIDQVPSMYSALKHAGKPLYSYARQGITIERPSRKITIYDFHLLKFFQDRCLLKVKCSKGTYVRTLVEDLGEVLGCGAHVTALRRLSAGAYPTEGMHTFVQLEETLNQKGMAAVDSLILPIESLFSHLPEVPLHSRDEFFLKQGQSIGQSGLEIGQKVALCNTKRQFIGVGEMVAPDQLKAVKLIPTH